MAHPAVRAVWAAATAVPVFVLAQDKLMGLHYVGPVQESGVELLPDAEQHGRWVLFRKSALIHKPNTPSFIPAAVMDTQVPHTGTCVRLPQPSGTGPASYRRVRGSATQSILTRSGFTEFVMPGRVWVEGDTVEEGGQDSVEWGQVPLSMVQGVAWAVVWPPEDLGLVPPALPQRSVDSADIFHSSSLSLVDELQASHLKAQQEARNALGKAYPFAAQVPEPTLPEEVPGSTGE